MARRRKADAAVPVAADETDGLPKGAEPAVARNFDPIAFNPVEDQSPLFIARHPGALGFTFGQLAELASTVYVGLVIGKRCNQVAALCRPQTSPYEGGTWVGLRDKKAKMSPAAEKRAAEILRLLLAAGGRYGLHGMGGMEPSVRALTRDSLTWDQYCFEPLKTRGGQVYGWCPVDASTMRAAKPSPKERASGHRYTDPDAVTTVQIDSLGAPVEEFGWHEMAWGIRRPRSWQMVGRYGYPEPEEVAFCIGTLLNTDTSNAAALVNGVHASMFVALTAALSPQQWQAFRQQTLGMLTGMRNAKRVPFVHFLPGKNEKLEVVPLETHTNREMEFMEWRRANAQLVFAAYGMHGSEAGFNWGPEGQKSSLGQGSPKDELRYSQESGLDPLLTSLSNSLSTWFVQLIDPDFACELRMPGENLDARMKRLVLEVQNWKTVNEARKENDLPELDSPAGNMILNTVYLQAAQSQQAPPMGEDDAGEELPEGWVAPEDEGFAEDMGKGGAQNFDALTRRMTAGAEEAMRSGRLVPRGRYTGRGRQTLVKSSVPGVRAWVVEV